MTGRRRFASKSVDVDIQAETEVAIEAWHLARWLWWRGNPDAGVWSGPDEDFDRLDLMIRNELEWTWGAARVGCLSCGETVLHCVVR